ncbi:MAG: hypothetical protein JRN11_06160 [Nitrososphaerota archaeon]|nr:hypothetical protein [Nitrososphaerota archaeon]MDG7026314.1 hypothetical protein [Nitrososphaerota archaeon]
MSDTSKSISNRLAIDKGLRGLEECEVHAYNYLDIVDGIAFLRARGKIPEYAATYYRSFFEYPITIMAWYSSIPVKEGSKEPYDTRSLSDNWASLVGWLRGAQEGTQAEGLRGGTSPPEMCEVLDDCRVDKKTMFKKVEHAIGQFEAV